MIRLGHVCAILEDIGTGAGDTLQSIFAPILGAAFFSETIDVFCIPYPVTFGPLFDVFDIPYLVAFFALFDVSHALFQSHCGCKLHSIQQDAAQETNSETICGLFGQPW